MTKNANTTELTVYDQGDSTWETTEPAALSAPVISSAIAGDEQVTLSYTTIGSAIDYDVRVAGSTVLSNVGAPPYTVISLTNDTSYTFEVRAFDGVNYSDWSSPVTSTPSEIVGFNYASSRYELKIKAPVAGLTTANRWYKAYPGLNYRTWVTVYGGAFDDLVYSLPVKPTGMTIDSATGEINWVATGSVDDVHNVTVQVTDGVQTKTVAWTITISDQFVFIDQAASPGGAGTIADPLSSVDELYNDLEADNTWQGYSIYFRAGTHAIIKQTPGDTRLQWGPQKPLHFIGYPGETVNLDMSDAHIFYDAIGTNTFAENIVLQDCGQNIAPGGDDFGVFGFRLTGDHVNFFNVRGTGIADLPASTNQSYVMMTAGTQKENLCIKACNFDGNNANAYAPCILYDTNEATCESNLVTNCGNIGFGYKDDNLRACVRGNWASGSGNPRLYWMYGPEYNENEIAFNVGIGGAGVYQQWTSVGPNMTGTTYVHHNTFVGYAQIANMSPSSENIFMQNNVWITTQANAVQFTFNVTSEAALVREGQLILADMSDVDAETMLLINSLAAQNATVGHNGFAGLK